jgi:hypothetical protein
MEGIFANWNFARSGESIVGIAAGRLSLSDGEGEGEGFIYDKFAAFIFEPLTSILSPCHKGRGEATRKLFACVVQKCSWRAVQQ